MIAIKTTKEVAVVVMVLIEVVVVVSIVVVIGGRPTVNSSSNRIGIDKDNLL